MDKSQSKPWYRFHNLADGSGNATPVLDIFDEIGGYGTWADEFIAALDNITEPELRVRLFSPGGYIDEGIQIYNALRRHNSRIVVEIDSLAASIASVIAMAGDEIRMSENAFMMIHDPWGGAVGDAADMRKVADTLDQFKEAIVLTYAKRTGMERAKIEDMMAEETWMIAADAVELGFADSVDAIEPAQSPAAASFAGRICNAFRHIPETMRDAFASTQPNTGLMLSPVAMANISKQDTQNSATADIKAGARPEYKAKEVVMKKGNTQEPAPDPIDLDAVRKEAQDSARETERERIHNIESAAERAQAAIGSTATELAREAVHSGKSLDEFHATLLEAVNNKASEQRSPIGLNHQEAQAFSINRALAAAATGDWGGAEFERDVCRAAAQRLGGLYKGKGVVVPTDVLLRSNRARNAVTTTVGAPTIHTDVLAGNFIELLRNKSRLRELGATVLDGLQGNVTLPRQTGAASAAWVAEGTAATPGDQTYDSVALSPKGVVASTQVTLLSLMQSSMGMEALTQNDLATVIALAIDLAGINGTGAGNQPTGILNTAGIGSVAMGTNGAALTNVDPFVDLETAVADANADESTMRYLTNSKVVGAMKKLKTTTGEYLFGSRDRDLPTAVGATNGYDVFRSNQVPKNLTKGTGTNLSAVLFGAWSSLLIGEWGSLVLNVEQVQGNPGLFNINALQYVDLGVRHPESFAAVTDIIA